MPSGGKPKPELPEEAPEEPTPAQELEQSQQARQETEEPLNQRRPIVRREIGVPFMDTQPTILVNTMETIVLEKLDSVLSRFKCCKCDRCKKDIVAISLNKLPSNYKVLLEGQPTPDLDPQTNAQVVAAMIQAVLAVRDHPRH